MKKFLYLFLLTFVSLFSLCQNAHAQQINAIQARCPQPSFLASSVRALSSGDIAYTPCAGFSSIFYGNADFSNATVTGISGTISGGTANFIPRYTSATAIGVTPMSWNGTSYVLSNTALTSDWRVTFTPNDTTGFFGVGNYTTANNNYFTLTESTGIFSLKTGGSITGISPVTNFGDVEGDLAGISILLSNTTQDVLIGDNISAGNSTVFTLNDANQTITNTANETRISNQFAIANSSTCVGNDTISGGGTITVTLTGCTVTAETLFLVSYNNTAVANVLPLSANRSGADLIVRGDAGATFNYWVINRY